MTPVVPWEVVVVTTPLLPAVVAVLTVRCCDDPMAGLEEVLAPRRVTRVRLVWALLLTVGLAAAVAVVVLGSQVLLPGADDAGSSALSAARNAAAFFSLGLLTAVLLGGDLGWTVPVLLVTALLFFGRDPDQVVREWALLLRPGDDAAAGLIVVLLVVLSAAAYSRRDTIGVLLAKD
ncbi:hypothetical protein [Intrasporangium sp.]|uniref:hypothetical protein n=1 Tax=Intrasporangium sp. TaxID=1925024 RepID=UPI003221DA34